MKVLLITCFLILSQFAQAENQQSDLLPEKEGLKVFFKQALKTLSPEILEEEGLKPFHNLVKQYEDSFSYNRRTRLLGKKFLYNSTIANYMMNSPEIRKAIEDSFKKIFYDIPSRPPTPSKTDNPPPEKELKIFFDKVLKTLSHETVEEKGLDPFYEVIRQYRSEFHGSSNNDQTLRLIREFLTSPKLESAFS